MSGIESNEPKKREDTVHFTRHSKASYSSYERIASSENPQAKIAKEDQVIPDITEAGVELAKKEAVKFLESLDPATDELFFVSSSQVRALETAAVYRDVAKAMGFDVLVPDNVRGEIATQIGGGDIRVVHNLALKPSNVLIDSIFNPDRTLPKINWDAVSPELKTKWEEAHKLIQEDDKGSWGANMFHHGAEIKKLFPEVDTAEELYENQFKNLLRLVEFGMKKAATTGREKHLKILAFGHENYISYALDKYFKEHEIKNCETVTFEPDASGGLSLRRQGAEATIEER